MVVLALPLRPAHRRASCRRDPGPALRLGHARVVGAGRRLGRRARRRGPRALPRADDERRGRRLAARRRPPLGRPGDAPRATTAAAGSCCDTRAGTLPEELAALAIERRRRAARRRWSRRPPPRSRELASAPARRRRAALRRRARARRGRRRRRGSSCTTASTASACGWRSLWDPALGDAFERLPGAEGGGRTLPLDPWVVERARRASWPLHGVEVDGPTPPTCWSDLRAEHAEAARGDPPLARDRGRADRRGRRRARRRRCSRSSGPACATCSTRGARSSPTSRAWARPSRRSPRWRPTTPSRRSSSAPRR